MSLITDTIINRTYHNGILTIFWQKGQSWQYIYDKEWLTFPDREPVGDVHGGVLDAEFLKLEFTTETELLIKEEIKKRYNL